jgi:hypothetical protein
MAATTLAAGELAIISYNTEDTGSPALDSISFVLLKAIGSGTQIFFTDRAWTGSAFTSGSGEGTYTYTAGGDLAAGTVITITQAQLTAAGMALLDTGESIYVYQGAINAPTAFLYAVDVADENTTFSGSLTNTGLSVAAGTAAAIGADNAAFGTRGYNIQLPTLLQQIANATDWVQNTNSPQPTQYTNGSNFFTAPDKQIWVASSGAGEAITMLNVDGTVSSSSVAYQITHAFQNDAALYHPSDITLDTVNDKFFFINADLAGHNQIMQGSISQVLANPGAAMVLTTLYSNTDSGATNSMRTLSIDPTNSKIYFDLGTTFVKINYNTAGQTPTVLANLGAGHYITQATIDYTNGEVYLGSSSVTTFFGQDIVDTNYIYKATGLTSSSSSLTFSQLPFNPDDDDAGAPNDADIFAMTGEAWPAERGTIRGVDVDPTGRVLYIVTGTVILDSSTAQDGSQMTTYYGGVYKYELTSNAAGNVTTLFQQDGTNGPVGLMYYIEVDPSTGKYYVIDETGANAAVGDGGVWTGSTASAGTPTLLGTVGNINGLGPQGLEIQDAPNIDSGTNLAPTITETAGNPSPAPTAVQPASTFSLSDLDSASGSSNLAGAQVRISSNFQSGSGHQDVLTISGATSGTSNGISYSYDSTTGVMTLTGITSFATYNTVLSLVRYHVTGDNPTNYGAAGTRTLSYSTFDGLLHSDEFNASVTVVGVNDAPVNTPGSAGAAAEDSTSNALTGISVFDVDANPATQDIRVVLSVAHGTITIRTDVASGIVAGDITAGANGSSTITITATQNQINATLANATGLVYTPTANFNGADALTIVTNDLGLNGTDAGLSGDGTSEQDSDTKTINVSAVNDAPVVSGDGTEDAATINEDLPSAVGQTVSSLFGGQFTDVTDDQTAFGGSSAHTLAGIAVIANGSSGATGQWQYWTGAAWTDIGTASAGAAKLIAAATAIRFNPAPDFNGAAPTLTVRLADSSGAAIVNAATVDLTSAFGGTTRYSSGTLVLSQTVNPINDAPTSTLLQGDGITFNEGSAPAKLDLGTNATIADVDSANFNGGSLTVSISGGVVTGEDQLGIDTSGVVTVAAGTVSVSAVAIGTYTGGGAGGGDLVFSLNANATPAAVQALVRALTYSNTETENPTGGARTITLTLVDGDGTDGGLGADTLTVTSSVTVVPVNDAPSGADNSATLFEDATYTFTTADFATGFSDAENNAFAGIKVTALAGAGTLMYDADGAGGAAAAVVAPNAVISAADIAAGKLTFVPGVNGYGAPYTTFEFAVKDDGGVANGGLEFDQSASTFTFNVTSVNDAPVLDLDSGAGGTGVAAAYTEADPATMLAPAATVTDADSADFNGGTLTVSFTANGTAADQLAVRNVGTGAGQIGVSVANITYGGTTIGTFTGGTNGSDLVITLNGSATAAAVQELARNVSFSNNSNAPSVLPRSVGFTLVDGDGNANSGSDTASATATITVTGINSAPTGGASITGTATEDQVLTAVSTLADAEGLGTLHYQWQHDVGSGFVNVGADQDTYTLGDSDVGGLVRVVISYTDGGGTLESATSSATAAIANVNDTPTGAVSVTGTVTEDQVLTADTSALVDADGLGTLHYQWQRDTGSGFTNVGADQSTYTLGDADVGGTIRVVTSYTDQQGTAESVTSSATAAVAAVNDAPTGGASITGTATEDQVLTAVSTLADVDGLGTLHYQWQHDVGSGFVNVGADQSTYTLGDSDVGGLVRVVISYTDGQGFANSATSSATPSISNINDPHTGGASVTGTAAEDQVLTAVSTMADADGLGTLHYQWQHDVGSGFVNVGADQSTYTLDDTDIGGTVRVVISYTDQQGTVESSTSSATTAVTSTNDAPTGGVSVTGTATEDQVLTADTSTLADSDGLGTLHYQWQHNVGSGFVNVGADQTTYTLGDSDVGGLVRVVVSYTDGQGFANSVTSSATTTIANVNDVPTGGASITGTATENQVLTAVSTMADADGVGTLHYQWQHDVGSGFVNVGADQSTYTLTDADVGGLVRVVISYTDQQGTAESSTSSSTTTISNVNDAPAGGVSITGTTTEDQALTADTSALTDDDGLGTLHYQWQRNTGSGFVNVGADQATYTLGDADVGGTIRVVTSYTDQQGTAESVTSSATAAIAAVNDPHTGGASVTGTATEDQMLTAVSTLADVDGLGTLHYQWQHDVGSGFVNVGADQSTYTLGDSDVGGLVRVVISYTDGQGFAESATSSATTTIANVNDVPTGGASITGTATEDQVLTAVSTLADADGLGTLHYQWQHDIGSGFVNVGADQDTYTLTDADVGGVVRVVISYTDVNGTAESATSSATASISNVNDAPAGGVAITGTTTEDQVLTADTSALTDDDGLGTLHYQWQRDTGSGWGTVGADQSTYTLGDADVGGVVRVLVSYTDSRGTFEVVTSAATAAIANVNDAPTGTVTITGTLTQGRTLTASNTLADADGLGAITYQWQADGTDIVGATGSTYVLTALEVGKAITVVAAYTDLQGTAEAVPSDPTAAIAADTDPPVVLTFSPTDDNTSVAVGSDITFTFSETVVAGTGNIVLQTLGGSVIETFDVATSTNLTFNGDTLTINPSADLAAGFAYQLVFDSGAVLDLAGNAFAGAPDYNFATVNLPINGTPWDDLLIGSAGDDVLDGAFGRDTMIGGLGNDTYYVDRFGDIVVEDPNAGADLVISSVTYVMVPNVENLTLTGNRLIDATGNELDNVIVGNVAKNVIDGGLGADTLTGGLGGDRFTLKSVNDSPAVPGEWDVITDFSRAQGDKIDLRFIDANVVKSGDQAFTFIGTAAFGSNATGQLRFDAGTHMLYGSIDADADAEFAIELVGVTIVGGIDILR